jgi:DNA-binding NarL/FixJ family response regulator
VLALLPASNPVDLSQVEPFGPDPTAPVHRYRRDVAPLPEIRATSVVLADDDDRFRALVRSVLEQDGYVVVGEAANAASARAAAREHHPDVVILDLVMHGSNGLSTLRELLDDDPDQPVLVISSLFDPMVEQEVVSLGAWYLEKAEGLDALEHMIDGMVSVSQHAR